MNVTHFELVIGGIATCIVAVIGALRTIRSSVVKPLARIADAAQEINEVVRGKEAVVRHGKVVEPAKPSIVERIEELREQGAATDRGVAGLYPRVDALERTVVEKRLPGTA